MISSSSLRLVAPLLATALVPLASGQTILTGTAGSKNSWNDGTNWSAGVPAGPVDAVIAAGVWGQVDDVNTQLYSGILTLEAGAMLTMAGAVGSEYAISGVAGITMRAGSEIQLNVSTGVLFPPITLEGDATLSTLFGASDWETDDFDTITGAHTLTLRHFNGHTVNLNKANDFSELVLDTVDRWTLRARAAGCLGTGDVTINPRSDGRSASLHIDVADAIADTGTLYLNGTPGQGGFSGNGSDYLVMNADDTIAALHVYGVQLPEGTYTNSEAWLDGPGTLTVQDPTGPIGTTYCDPSNLNSSGQSGVIGGWGKLTAAKNDVRLDATGLPKGQFGIFLVGPQTGFTSNYGGGQGILCLAPGTFGAYIAGIQNSGSNGAFSLQLDLDQTPTPSGNVAIQAGETWNFQAWYRDRNPTTTTNFTDAVSITFQ